MGACARNMQSDPAEIKPAQCSIKLVFHLTYTLKFALQLGKRQGKTLSQGSRSVPVGNTNNLATITQSNDIFYQNTATYTIISILVWPFYILNYRIVHRIQNGVQRITPIFVRFLSIFYIIRYLLFPLSCIEIQFRLLAGLFVPPFEWFSWQKKCIGSLFQSDLVLFSN